ncbi:glycoside hydrolase family 24 [Phormidium sp. CCY1219]|uniref:glycoside hydrolase family 24 n=1 Tax=Phormidium sp. CCY1219 TaxID=2886104 RepID=UPI002D1ED0AA|nr:glycoside hydrolase family 24 [Phormidium sp. CCY1219]MEB3828232.1 glycoside hydrolase family 24 [Phormidium sp. CCY1219]
MNQDQLLVEDSRIGYSDTELIQLWVQQKAPHQRRWAWRLVKEFLRFVGKPLGTVTLADVQRYAQAIAARGIPPKKAARRLGTLKSLFGFAYQIRAVPMNIALHRWPKVKRRRSPNSWRSAAAIFLQKYLSSSPTAWRRSPHKRSNRQIFGMWLGFLLCLGGLSLTVSRHISPEESTPSKRERRASDAPGDALSPPQGSARIAALKQAYVKAFLDTIAWAEGTAGPDAYRMQFTGTTFSSFADHPREIKCGWRYGQRLCSDAAGRYQFLSTSWDRLAKRIGAKDFSPANQDRAAIAMLEEYGVLADIEAGLIHFAVLELMPVWPSFRDVGEGDRTKAISRVEAVYQEKLTQYHPDR